MVIVQQKNGGGAVWPIYSLQEWVGLSARCWWGGREAGKAGRRQTSADEMRGKMIHPST